MATISKYETASGATLYRVRYRTPDNRQTDKRGFRTKRDAEVFANTVEVKKLRGEYIPETAGRVTVAELAPDWLTRKEQATAPSNYRMIESAWRVHVKPKWGHWQVSKVTVPDIESWVAHMAREGRGATTVLRAHGVLSGVLADAVKARRLASNPLAASKGYRERRLDGTCTCRQPMCTGWPPNRESTGPWCTSWRSAESAGGKPSHYGSATWSS